MRVVFLFTQSNSFKSNLIGVSLFLTVKLCFKRWSELTIFGETQLEHKRPGTMEVR